MDELTGNSFFFFFFFKYLKECQLRLSYNHMDELTGQFIFSWFLKTSNVEF